MAVTGWTMYRELLAHQVDAYLPVWEAFLLQTRPARLLEIGTADGGFILSLKDRMNVINPDCEVRSYDILARDWYPFLRSGGVDVRVENMFTYAYDDLLPEQREEVRQFIHRPGTSVVICDGGSKKNEFRLLAPLLKEGDYILAHDYAVTREQFDADINGRLWNWCEITERDLHDASVACHLAPRMAEAFRTIMWVCKERTNAPRFAEAACGERPEG